MYKHILVPVDGSELSLKAFPQALALAKALGAKVTAITVITPFHVRFAGPIAEEIVHAVEHQKDEVSKEPATKLHADLTARAQAAGVEFKGLIELDDNPYARIIESAEAGGCDLIVMASHGRRGLDALLIGSETVKVLTHSKVPVLVVR